MSLLDPPGVLRADPRLTDQRVPKDGILYALLQGRWVRVQANGHSGMVGVGGARNGSIAHRLSGVLKIAVTNNAVGGAAASWHTGSGVANSGEGGYPYVLQNVGVAEKNQNPSQLISPYLPWPAGADVLGTLMYGFNDPLRDCTLAGTTAPYAQSVKSMIHAMRRCISRYRAARIIEDNTLGAYAVLSGTIGGWSDLNAADTVGSYGEWASSGALSDRNSGTRYQLTSTVGDGVQLLTAADMSDDVVIAFGGVCLASDDIVLTATMSNPDGSGATTLGTLDIKDVRSPTTGKYSAWCWRFKGPWGYTPKLIKVRMTTRTAGSFRFDDLTIESPIPSPVLVYGAWKPQGNTFYAFGTSVADRDAKIDSMNTQLQSLVAEFAPQSGLPNPVLFVDADTPMGPKDPAKFDQSDGLHPSNAGHVALTTAGLTAVKNYLAVDRDPTLMAAGA